MSESVEGTPVTPEAHRGDVPLLSDVLPMPTPRFAGRIGNTYADSEADTISVPSPPAGAPNVVVVLLDDVGFGQAGTFGGPADTPTLQRLAEDGLRYNRFHTTALCSPTRAALLSGRNHHSVHTGVITEMATGFPGYDGSWPREAACIAEVLKGNQYSTAAFGKWHNTPDHELGAPGPFDRWPVGKGFDYFFGFQGGESSQWYPPLYENTAPVEPPHDDPAWHFSEAIADKAIGWISQQNAAAPDKPFFLYFAPGACHSPHHVAKEWADKYRGKFDHGWDRQREITFENQKKLGVVPQDTKLTPRPDSIPAWDSCSPDEKRLFAAMQEVFAGFLEHVDAQVGRVVDAIEQMGLRDDTLIMYIVGDNGPSAEGSVTGTLNNMKTQLGLSDDVSRMLEHIDEIGSAQFENHYPVGWCWAGSSPFQWMKQVASHFGGTRNGLVMSWPGHITDQGGLRSQFHHVIDIAPTILEVAGIPEPREVNGVPQKPIEGISMAYTFGDEAVPGRRITQYFEMLGNRALYHDGWVAGCLHGRLPWLTAGGASFDDDTWELYNIDQDFSQADDLADAEPKKLRDLQDRFMAEAAKSDVLIPSDGAEGVLVCCGGISGGYTLFVKDGNLHWEHNYYNEIHYRVTSTEPIPPGHHVLSAEVTVDEENKFGTGGNVTLRIGTTTIGEGRFDQQVAGYFTPNETFDVGCDTCSPVSDLYESPFPFTGQIVKVIVDISEATFDQLARQHETHARWAMATQ